MRATQLFKMSAACSVLDDTGHATGFPQYGPATWEYDILWRQLIKHVLIKKREINLIDPSYFQDQKGERRAEMINFVEQQLWPVKSFFPFRC